MMRRRVTIRELAWMIVILVLAVDVLVRLVVAHWLAAAAVAAGVLVFRRRRAFLEGARWHWASPLAKRLTGRRR